MTKSLLSAALQSSVAAVSFAQTAAKPMHGKKHKAHHNKKAASAPMAAPAAAVTQ